MMAPDIPNLTDRELLVQQAVSLKKICGDISELKVENKSEHGAISKKVDSVVVGKISNRLFFWLVGLMIVVQIGLITFVGDLNMQVTKNTSNIEHVQHKLNRMSGG